MHSIDFDFRFQRSIIEKHLKELDAYLKCLDLTNAEILAITLQLELNCLEGLIKRAQKGGTKLL